MYRYDQEKKHVKPTLVIEDDARPYETIFKAYLRCSCQEDGKQTTSSPAPAQKLELRFHPKTSNIGLSLEATDQVDIK